MSAQDNSGGGAKTGTPGNRQRATPKVSRPASSGNRDTVTENVGPAGVEDKIRRAPRLERDDLPKKDIRVPDDKGADAGGDASGVGGQKADDNATARVRPPVTPNTSWSPSGDGSASPSGPPASPIGSPPPRPGVVGGMTADPPGFPGKASPRPDGAGPSRSPRKAHLILRRVEPWSAMKFSFVVSLVCFVVLFVAVAVLYGVLSALGVFDSIVQTVTQLTAGEGTKQTTGGIDIATWFEPVRILGYTALIGAVNVVLITALSTLGAVIYNVASDLVGGIEVTFSEAE